MIGSEIQVENLIFTGRASAALFAILKSLDFTVKKILVPVNICEILYPIIINAGFIPIFYDVDELTGNASLEDVQQKHSGDETILLSVHNFGIPLEIEKISAWAKENNIFLIEDVCNSLGARHKNRRLGIIGDAALYSFGHAKILECGFGGGAVIKDQSLRVKAKKLVDSFEYYSLVHETRNREFQERIRQLRINKQQRPEVYVPLYNSYFDYLIYQLDESAKEMIKQSFNKLPLILKGRNNKAAKYREGIDNPLVQHIPEIEGQVYWRYNIIVDKPCRDQLLAILWKNNIPASSWYPPINTFFDNSAHKDEFPGSSEFSSRVINLFLDDKITDKEMNTTIYLINEFR
jgi:dTDP-4-amino-4,6-dideoxygalactose transaminase